MLIFWGVDLMTLRSELKEMSAVHSRMKRRFTAMPCQVCALPIFSLHFPVQVFPVPSQQKKLLLQSFQMEDHQMYVLIAHLILSQHPYKLSTSLVKFHLVIFQEGQHHLTLEMALHLLKVLHVS